MDDLFHEMPGTLVSRSAVAKAKKRGEVYESAKAGGAIGAMAGGGLGTASGLGLIASGAAEPMIRQNPSKAGRALTRTFVPLNTGVRGAARWGVAGVGLGAAAGVYGKHKRNKQSSEVSKLFGPKSRGLTIAEYDPVTRQRRSSSSGYEGHYTYKGKSKILRRPEYTYAVTPKKTSKNKTYVGGKVKGNRQASRLMHDSWQDKKSFNVGDIRFKPAKMHQELIGKAFLKPMAPMKPQAVLKPKPLKIAKPQAALKPKRPVS